MPNLHYYPYCFRRHRDAARKFIGCERRDIGVNERRSAAVTDKINSTG